MVLFFYVNYILHGDISTSLTVILLQIKKFLLKNNQFSVQEGPEKVTQLFIDFFITIFKLIIVDKFKQCLI